MVGHGGSSAGSYLADPTSPTPPTVHQLSRLALYQQTPAFFDDIYYVWPMYWSSYPTYDAGTNIYGERYLPKRNGAKMSRDVSYLLFYLDIFESHLPPVRH